MNYPADIINVVIEELIHHHYELPTFDQINRLVKHTRAIVNSLKRLPKNPTITHFKELLAHHDWLVSFGYVENYLQDISKIKLQQFSAEAKSLDASDFKEMNNNRRYALIICLIYHAQRRAKDALAIMYCRTMAKMHKKANEKLKLLREQEEEKTKRLLGAFYDVLVVCKEDNSPDIMGNNILKTISNHGGIGALHSECEQIVAYHSDNAGRIDYIEHFKN